MSERFQLVFKGETLEGQPVAEVVRQLAARLGLDEGQARAMFGQGAVVIKRSVSRQDAARYQAVFKAAGARLRVVPLPSQTDATAPQSTPQQVGLRAPAANADLQPEPHAAATASVTGAVAGWTLSEQRGDLVQPDEIRRPAPLQVSTEHLALAPQAPWQQEQPPAAPVSAPDYDVAPAGSELPAQPRPDPVCVDDHHLDLAPPGAELEVHRPPPVPAPDTSHLHLSDDDGVAGRS